MLYLITTNEDKDAVMSCVNEGVSFDSIILWENRKDAYRILDICNDDTVVLAIRIKQIFSLIREELSVRMAAERIIDFYNIYSANIPFMTAKRVLGDQNYDEYNGIILGLSHAEVGIVAENLKYPTANLSVSSQDLFYNLISLIYAIDNYGDKIKNLKYLILDMYKYNYFNFDTSMSKMMYGYLIGGGYSEHPHNYSSNPNMVFSYERLLYLIFNEGVYSGINQDTIASWSRFFHFDQSSVNKELLSNYPTLNTRNGIITDEELEQYNYSPSNVLKHFDDTIDENCALFEELIRVAKEFNPDIKIYVMQMPMYRPAWERSAKYYNPWKQEFENIIKSVQSKYDFEYLDWTCHPISEERRYWFDTEHLNYLGALKFTGCINEILP